MQLYQAFHILESEIYIINGHPHALLNETLPEVAAKVIAANSSIIVSEILAN